MKPFKFKEFTIHQDQCAMKVGTDGVLLGAWASLDNQPESILDIGAGTGLIALQLAQRSLAETIDGIELDDDAYEQCVSNFEASSWGDRLFCYHAGFDEFVDEIEDKYDLIVSNPPFYIEDVATRDESRDKARQSSSLPFDELVQGASELLTEKGLFAVIIPYKEELGFVELAKSVGLFPNRITRVKGNPDADFKRSLMEFSFDANKPHIDTLIIEEGRHQYTKEYIELTQAFYLKM
ncbi:MAG TPA: tRNA (adenine-N(6)-)-methyltransferase [Muricauda sp.]|uniref:tRNA1(Val) (adenine(37)-N6)-methyltransferase n=1 Tax=Flagellimonas aurea TaxID=2915619 RepID=A0ABS3G636_9FLAO|nr:methyltransferase [Allomuricauda aurea]MAO17701.1 tRNA (adenine-N(6)-)-methyltransferase [Allomuricauda sp.]MBO0354850.1 methyltransferase [Allomuricauda aurea]UBZ12448.1 methyltransferase [Allomuricauda aquimarina]HBU77554.1 tRNA (adenine-N(6)-)-methyltransferase [Allomuricauda sp.]|tara:strand:+ start:1196 stop:1906 length:711 start_codon:yes stop_codon:yes gene_type:complete